MDDSILINEDAAHEIAKGIDDAVVRNLVLLGVAVARMRAIRQVGQTEADWQALLPEQPFDMRYFAQVLVTMFERPSMVRAVLDGQDLAQASGWDV